MASQYSQYSPYAKTKQTWFLDYNLPRTMYKADTDVSYTIPSKYNEQPWRLAKELYGHEELYYIFALLNPDLLIDPTYDFITGLVIQIPTLERVQQYLNGTRNIK